MFYTVNKIICLVVYALAITSLFIALPAIMGDIPLYITGVLLIAHALEVVIFMKHIKLYKGSLHVSIILTILFGLLHWKPMADNAAAEQSD